MVGTRRSTKMVGTRRTRELQTMQTQAGNNYKRRKLTTTTSNIDTTAITFLNEKPAHKGKEAAVCLGEVQIASSSCTNEKECNKLSNKGMAVGEIDKDSIFSLPSDSEETEEGTTEKENISFSLHFEREVKLEEIQDKKELEFNLPCIGNFRYISNPKIKINLLNSIDAVTYRVKPKDTLSPLQKELLNIFYKYIDMFYDSKTVDSREVQVAYCLHSLNHILTSNSKISHHNNKIKKHKSIPDEFRDQGFTRPKVLIIVPFKNDALEIVMTMTTLLEGTEIMNKKKFFMEYGNEKAILKGIKPSDYEATFKGNIDDSFRIGIAIKRKSIKLYSDFYSSDLIIASPLGLRTIIGVSGEEGCDYDFLSSIEILILDKCDIFLMQNWDHVINIMHHLHQKPQKSHDCNYFRVRMWLLDGYAKLYRQTLIFSSLSTPQILSLFNKHCSNHAGKIMLKNTVLQGSITKILVQLPQVFQRFDASSIQSISEERFTFFVKKILPQFRNTTLSNVLVFVSYYWDFVRLRNYFRQQDISFTQMCEYSKREKIAEARDLFFHGHRKFVLFTERFHFFHRYQIKGISHIIFYHLPIYPHFYAELCNFMNYGMQNKKVSVLKSTCTVLYCKYDFLQLANIVGTEKANYLLSGDKDVHMFVSGT